MTEFDKIMKEHPEALAEAKAVVALQEILAEAIGDREYTPQQKRILSGNDLSVCELVRELFDLGLILDFRVIPYEK